MPSFLLLKNHTYSPIIRNEPIHKLFYMTFAVGIGFGVYLNIPQRKPCGIDVRIPACAFSTAAAQSNFHAFYLALFGFAAAANAWSFTFIS